MTRRRNLRLETTARVWDTGKHREVIVEFSPSSPDLIIVRLKGTRRSYPIGADAIYRLALVGAVDAARREMKAARTAKKGTRK